ncbi:MAG: hypothetical protein RLN69_10320 [Woeseiaceae bacterium]
MLVTIVRLLPLAALLACHNAPRERALTFELPPVASPDSVTPRLASTVDGQPVLSWQEPSEIGMTLRAARLDEDVWQQPVTIAEGDNWFVNWADFPSVLPVTREFWAAHWLVRTPGNTYSYNVAIALSNDGGMSWSEAITPHDDNTATEHGFVSLYPLQGALGAVWLDGRNTAATGHEAGHSGGMTLRSARIASDGSISDAKLIDELVCDCCQTDVAIGGSGPIAVYRNRSNEEIRDIHVSRFVDRQWQADAAVANDNWKIAACPVNGPAIARNDDALAVAWFTAADEDSKVRLAWSFDDAVSFAEAVDIDVDLPVGRVDIEMLANGVAVVSWLRATVNGDAEVCIRTVASDGSLGPVHAIANTGANRASGFPQLLYTGNQLLLAWTDTSGETSQVRSATINLAMLLDGSGTL